MGPQQAVRCLDGLIIFYGKFYIPIPSFALAMFSCVGFQPWIMVWRWCETASSTWFFPSQKVFFFFSKSHFNCYSFLLYLSFLASSLLYAVEFPRLLLALCSACICCLSSFHQWIQPVLPPEFCPNMSCHSSLMTATFFHVSFYF